MENYFVERNQDSDTLIIAFTGMAEKLMGDSFEFFAVTNTLNCNRILLKDPSKQIFLRGIGGEINSLKKLLRKLKADIEAINPKVVTIIGTSGGGFAAILYGHLLKANFVHAFGPVTYVNVGRVLKNLRWKTFKKHYKKFIFFYILHPGLRKYLDLREALSHHNGVTKYSIYVCEGHEKDVLAANHLNDCKNLKIFKQPCDVHNVVRCMIKNQKLFQIFNTGTTDVVSS